MSPLFSKVAAITVAMIAIAPAAFAKDERVKLEQLPPATRATVEREASGGKIEHIEKVSDDGKLFEIEIEPKQGQEFELFVNDKGEVVGRQVE